MNTNVERKGKEKPKERKKGRKKKGNEPTIPSLKREMNDRQEQNALICTTPDVGNGENAQFRDMLVPLERVELCW